MNQTEIIKELSIYVALLLDEYTFSKGGNELVVATADDIFYVQNLITKLENMQEVGEQ